MKKIILLAFFSLLFLLSSCASFKAPIIDESKLETSASYIRAFNVLSGGGTGALDKVVSTNLNNLDLALVLSENDGALFYIYDSSATDNPCVSPGCIAPDDVDGTGDPGRWVLLDPNIDGHIESLIGANTYIASEDTDLESAIDDANSLNDYCVLIVDVTQAMTASKTIDAEVYTVGIEGYTITTSGYSLTFGGPFKGVTGMFAGTGTVNFDGPVIAAKNMFSGNATIDIDGDFIAGQYQVWPIGATVTWGHSPPDLLQEWWGAAADGATDSFGTLQAAYTSLDGNAGVIELLGGEYLWGGTTTDLDNIILKGQGWQHTKVTLQDDGDLTASLPTVGKILDATNCTIQGIHFDNGAWEATDDVRVFWSEGEDNNTIQDCKFSCGGKPIHLGGGDGHKVLRNILVNDATPSNGGVPSICVVKEYATGDAATNCSIKDNSIEAATCTNANGNIYCSLNLQTAYSEISGNFAGGSYVAGLLLEDGGNEDTENNLIHDNIVDTSNHVESSMYGFYIQQVKSADVYDNDITVTSETNSNGIQYQPSTTITVPIVKFKNNTIKGGHDSFYAASSGTTHNGTIVYKGNLMQGPNKAGIEILASTGTANEDAVIDISDNTMNEVVGTGTARALILGLREESGYLNLINNHVVCDSTYARAQVIDLGILPPATIGGNSFESNGSSAAELYYFYTPGNSMSGSDFANVKFVDINCTQAPAPFDLNGGSGVSHYFPVTGDSEKCVLKLTYLYVTETTSADAGITIAARWWGSGGAANTFHNYTTTTNTAAGNYDEVYLPDFTTFSKAYDLDATSEFIEIYCACNKTGAGEVLVSFEWIDND